MLQGFSLSRAHFYISDKFVHGPMEKDEACLLGYLSETCMWWDGCHVSCNMFPRSRLNARAYSSVLSPLTSDSTCLTPPHFPASSACMAYMAIPISTWDQKSKSWDPGSHSTQLIEEQVLNFIIRPLCRGHPRGWFGRKSLPKLADFSLSWAEGEKKMYRMYREIQNLDQNFLKSWNCLKTSLYLKALGWLLLCGAYTDRRVNTCWPTTSFTKMILSEILCTSKTFSIHSLATNTLTPAVPLSFMDQLSCT